MGTRSMTRHALRREYEQFSRYWRDQTRLSGKYGTKDARRKPTFNQWMAWKADFERQKAPPPAQYNEVRLHEPGTDPWAEEPAAEAPSENRGVVTIPIVGGDDE